MKTVPQRLADLRAAMEKSGCHAYLMPSSDPHASEYAPAHYTAWEYFSGFSCENANLVVTLQEAALWVDGRFFGAADAALAGTGVASMHMGVKGVPTLSEYLTEKLQPGQVLGYTAEVMPLSQLRRLEALAKKEGFALSPLPLVDEVWTEDRPALPATPVWLLDTRFAGLSPAEKLTKLREALVQLEADAMVVTRLDSVAWLLNLRAEDIDHTPYALAFAYVDMDKAVLFTDGSRVPQEAKDALAQAGVSLEDYQALPGYIGEISQPRTVLFEPGSLNAALYNALRENPACTLLEKADPISMMKAVKNETEIAATRQAHLSDGAAMVRFQMELEKRLSNGEALRETDVDEILLRHRSRGEGFLFPSFSTIAAWGPNAAMMHYAPKAGSDAQIGTDGFLLVDCGGTYYQGTTDITRTYAIGDISEAHKLAYTRVLRCHIDVAMAVWQAGATGGELDMLARQPMWRHMLDYRCGTGHSVSHVGAVHEGPHSLRPHNNVAFQPGMIVTDEPGIYEEGEVGIRVENELVCVEAGESPYGRFLKFEPITFCPIDVSCVLPEELTREERQWLNGYHAQVLEKLSPLLTGEEIAWLTTKCAPI